MVAGGRGLGGNSLNENTGGRSAREEIILFALLIMRLVFEGLQRCMSAVMSLALRMKKYFRQYSWKAKNGVFSN